jgi:hypothetical protein
MTCPILQLKVSRLRHNKFFPDKGDYFQARCNDELVVCQLFKRMDGMLSANIVGTPIKLRFDPVTLEAKLHGLFTYEICSAERPPEALAEHIHNLPVGAYRLDLLNKWFKFSEPYIHSINEFL